MEKVIQNSQKPSRVAGRLTALVQWFDSDYEGGVTAAQERSERIDWFRCLPFVILHLGCVGVIWTGWSWFAVGAAAALYLGRMFAVTAFYHRYFSHRSFQTSRFWQFVFAVWGATAVQRGALWWAHHHRHHHRHSDTEADAHSPRKRGFLWAHVGWFACSRNFRTDYTRIRDFAKFPELVFLNRFDALVPALFAIALFALGWILEVAAPGLGVTGPQLLVWGFFISTTALFHLTCSINSLAHVVGRQRFATGDESRNSFLLALFTLGEGWHNNHHHYMHSTRQGFYWWEIDVTFYTLKLFEKLGLIWNLRPVPERVYATAAATPSPPSAVPAP